MSHRDSPAICRRIDAALDFLGNDDELRPYIMFQIGEILSGRERISMDDCATSELMTILSTLLPVFARRLAGRGVSDAFPLESAKILTLILNDDGDANTGTEA
jgi:hypothetical protein